MKSMKYFLGLKENTDQSRMYKEHFLQTVAAFKYISKLRIPTVETLKSIKLNCARLEHSQLYSKFFYSNQFLINFRKKNRCF